MQNATSVSGGVAPAVITVWNGGLTDPAAAIVNEYGVLSIPAFWSGVRFLSETLGSMPKAVYQRQENSRKPISHAQNKLLSRKANPYAIPAVVFETWHSHAIIHGNGYMYVERDKRTGQPVGYHNLNPDAVMPFKFDGQKWFQVKGGTITNGKPDDLYLADPDCLHLPGLGFDGMIGYRVVWLMSESIELARNSQRFASKYLKKGTQLQGSIECPATATQEQVDAIIDRLRRNHGGIDSDYTFSILTGGATLKNTTIPPEESQLLQSRQFSVIDMCRILRVPPHIVYELGKATWSNVESLGVEVIKYSLVPWIEKAQQELSSKIFTEAEQDQGLFVRYAVESLMRGEPAAQSAMIMAQVNGGFITLNEGRAMQDLSPLPDPAANTIRIPVNFPVAAPAAPAPAPATAPAPAEPDTSGDEQDFAAALAPVLADAARRVDQKTEKAFASRTGKPAQEVIAWGNVFATEQERFCLDALAPVASAFAALTGKAINAEAIARHYADSVKSRAAGRESKTLSTIINDHLGDTK